MKKILMALTMTGLTYLSAEAQTNNTKSCEVKQTQVCSKGRDCYNTKYAENFKVCKCNAGYFICCETPNNANSTHPAVTYANQNPSYYQYDNTYYPPQVEAVDQQAFATPQSQSYAGYSVNRASSYEGFYPRKNKMKVCYVGDNVAELTRAPYKGCPSPQDDGPELNNMRNVNVVTPAQ